MCQLITLILSIAFTIFSSFTLFAKESTLNSTETSSTINENSIIVNASAIKESGTLVINQTQIQESKAISLIDLLRQQANINVSQNSPAQPAFISINGSKKEHVLILINGVKITDPSTIGGNIDTSQIPLNFIEQIEVLTGSSALKYGESAIGGVINIQTKQSLNAFSIATEYGSKHTSNNQIGLAFSKNNFEAKIFGSFNRSNNISTAKYNSNNSLATELDPYSIYDLNLNLKYNHNYNFIEIFYKKNKSNISYDDFGANFPIDSELNNNKNDQDFIYIKTHQFVNDNFNHEIILSKTNTTRDYYSTYPSSYLGNYNSLKYLANTNYSFLSSTFGINLENSKLETTTETGENTNLTPFISLKENLNSWLNLEQSFSYNSRFSSNKSFHNYSYSLAINTQMSQNNYLSLEYSNKYNPPSLYQQYSSFGGNLDLDVEKSSSLNLELKNNYFTFNTFYQKVTNLISYTSQYENIGDYNNYGFNFSFWLFFYNFKILPSYSYVKAFNNKTKIQAPYIPQHKINIDFTYTKNNYSLILNTIYVAKRQDPTAFNQSYLHSYAVTNLISSYKIENITIYGKIINLFNTEYENVYGYNTQKRIFLIGIIYDYN